MHRPPFRRRKSSAPSLERIDEKEFDFDESFLDRSFTEEDSFDTSSRTSSFNLDDLDDISLLREERFMLSRPATPAPGAISSSSSSMDSDDSERSSDDDDSDSDNETDLDSCSDTSIPSKPTPPKPPRSPLSPPTSDLAKTTHQSLCPAWQEIRLEFNSDTVRPSRSESRYETVDVVASRLARYFPWRVAKLLFEEGGIGEEDDL